MPTPARWPSARAWPPASRRLDAITLWTHVGDLDRTAAVKLEVARDPGFRQRGAQGRARRRPACRLLGEDPGARPGPARAVPLPLLHLARASRAWAASAPRRPRTRGSPSGSPSSPARTGRPATSPRTPTWLDQDLDLVVCLGDYIYERNFYEGPRDRHDSAGTATARSRRSPSTATSTRSTTRDKNLRDMHAARSRWSPSGTTTRSRTTGRATSRAAPAQDPRVKFLKRRRNGFQAFFEHHPISQDPQRSHPDLRARVRLGRNLDLFLLDERQYRSDQPCNDRALIPCAVERAR